MKRSHVMDGSMKGVRIASLVLLTVVILQAFVVNSVLGPDPTDPTLETDKPSYPIGGTVTFSGSGYIVGDPAITYVIDISYVKDDLLVESLEFTPGADTAIPAEVSWAIPFGAKNGTYLAEAYDKSVPESVLASVEFQVLNATEALKTIEGNLTDLKDLVISEVDIMGINNSLLASLNNSIRKLEAAMALFEDGENKTAANQMRAARNMLTAFVHKVLAQTGKKIDEKTAGYLVGNASVYIEYIDSLIGTTLVPLGKKFALNVEKTLAKQEEHMAKFMMRKGLDDATTDEELLSLLNSMEEELNGALGRAKGKMQLLQDLLDSGVITDDEYQALLMELEKGGDSVNLVKALSELLAQKLEELNQNRPGLGEHLGQLIKAAKQLVDDSTAAGESHGKLMSEAHSHGNKHGDNDDGDDNNGNGNGNGNSDHGNGNDNSDHGNGNSDHGDGNSDHGNSDHGNSDHDKGGNGKGKGKNN